MNVSKVHDYLSGPFKNVEGWCIPQLWQCIQPIAELQDEMNINLPVAEIGVYHGKFLIALMKTKSVANNFAIDVFDMQEFNMDKAGEGSLEKLKANLQMTGESLEDIEFMARDSMTITRQDLNYLRERSGGFSFFSVDGCHMVEHTMNDIEVAMEVTDPRGIIFVDDYNNANWPGVQEAVGKMFFAGSPRWVPLLLTCNKLFMAHISYKDRYLAHVQKHLREHFPTTRVKPCPRFGYQTLTVQPDMKEGPFLHMA